MKFDPMDALVDYVSLLYHEARNVMKRDAGKKVNFYNRGRSFRACITYLEPVHEGFYGVTDNETECPKAKGD